MMNSTMRHHSRGGQVTEGGMQRRDMLARRHNINELLFKLHMMEEFDGT
jgi:hypothetical protein